MLEIDTRMGATNCFESTTMNRGWDSNYDLTIAALDAFSPIKGIRGGTDSTTIEAGNNIECDINYNMDCDIDTKFDTLPLELLQLIINKLDQNDLISLAKTCHKFRYICNKKLYNKIIIGNDVNHDQYSNLHETNLTKFISGLNEFNCQFINKMVTFVDDAQLYNKLLAHNANLSLIPYSASFNNYHCFVSKNWFYKNFDSLKNWLIVNEHDLISVPYNENLQHLNLFIPNSLSPIDAGLFNNNSNLSINFQNLASLYLSTPRATMLFSQYNGPLNNLTNLSICNYHNYNPNSKLKLDNFRNVNWDKLNCLELKLACTCDCDCIYQFISQLPPMNLKKFAIINYKSCTDTRNIYQFQQIFKLLGKFTSDLTYININEFGTNQFDWKLLTNIRSQNLIIPDFFNTYKFALNFNKCDCCVNIRNKFNRLAIEDAENNYIHKFSGKRADCSNEIIKNQTTTRFFNYLITQSKNQYKYLNQGIFMTTSIMDLEDLPIKYDESLNEWKQLIEHNLGEIILQLKENKVLNLSGFEFN